MSVMPYNHKATETPAARRIYLDHAASSPLRPESREAMLGALSVSGNPSSLHWFGREARRLLDEARDILAGALNCHPAEVIFTGGGSESCNLALSGACRARPDRRHVLVSAVEHHAVLHTADALRADGFEVEIIPVDAAGRVDPGVLKKRLRPDTALVSVMAANNEIGSRQPIRAIADLCRRHSVIFHTDAIQAFGRIPAADLDADLVSIAAHKLGGPIGAGALRVREDVELRPTAFGGAQERGRRGGTENTAAIVGMAAAVRALEQTGAEEAVQERALILRLRERLSGLGGAWFNTPQEGALPTILNVGFEGIRAQTLLLGFDREGLAASSGSACASGSLEPSHVLRAIGLTQDQARSCIRFSVGWTTTADEIEAAAGIIETVVGRLRSR
jgi:cysteine desulfurase